MADTSKFSLEVGGGSEYFATHAIIDTAVYISKAALDRLGKCDPCWLVEVDAENLPFYNGCIDDSFFNDVMHHIKADGYLKIAGAEINRVPYNPWQHIRIGPHY